MKSVRRTKLKARVPAKPDPFKSLGPDELKEAVYFALIAQPSTTRPRFVEALEYGMYRNGMNLREYLLPVGIPGKSVDDITPQEIGHLARFFKRHVPEAMRIFVETAKSFGNVYSLIAERALNG